jgi:hypothetical protein
MFCFEGCMHSPVVRPPNANDAHQAQVPREVTIHPIFPIEDVVWMHKKQPAPSDLLIIMVMIYWI